MERARELFRPYIEMHGVLGGYVLGSSTRPYRDRISDYDIEVVVTDQAYASMPLEQRLVYVIDEGPPRRVDHEFYVRPWSEFEALPETPLDLFHFAYQHAVILHDPEGRIAGVIERLAVLPSDVRFDRMRVHYLEFVFGCGRTRKTLVREGAFNARLLAVEAIKSLAKLFFLQTGSWAPTTHWTEQELGLLKLPEALLVQIKQATQAPDGNSLKELVDAVNQWLTGQGETFHQDTNALSRWLYLTEAGKRVFATWCSR